MRDLIRIIKAMGLPEGAHIIHAFVGGSGLHGIKREGKDDLDIYAAFIEGPEEALGLDPLAHFVTSTAPESERNKATDVDVTCYSLRRWAGLAAQGNPTVLHYLFAPTTGSGSEWQEILRHTGLYLAKSHSQKFIGFADAQLKRMVGLRGAGRHGQRDELTEQFGFDVKAAMHVLRLLYEGIDLMRTGTITFPRPEKEILLQVRTGAWSQDRVIQHSQRLFRDLDQATQESKLEERINREKVSQLVARVYRESWSARGVG